MMSSRRFTFPQSSRILRGVHSEPFSPNFAVVIHAPIVWRGIFICVFAAVRRCVLGIGVFQRSLKHFFSLAVDSATALMIQYVAFKEKTLRLGAVCNPIKERYASEARHILEEIDCSPEKRYGQGNHRS